MPRNSSGFFFDKLQARVTAIDSLLCVGLDPHEAELHEFTPDAAFSFCQSLIAATLPFAACYKPNAAFFEALGDEGASTLRRVIQAIPDEIPVLLDVKRGDIGSTAAAYAKACYDLGADGVTLSPLMGWDSVEPFVKERGGAFVLCKTSNPGSNDLLALRLASGETLFERIAHLAGQQWTNCGLVVGATDPQALSLARAAAGDAVWILAPGVGAQGGNLEASVREGLNQQGTGLLIPVSRGISRAENPGQAAKDLMEQIQSVRAKVLEGAAAATTGENIQPYQKEFLEFALEQGVLKFGSFVLKSGRTSPYFFNAGLFASGAALFKLGKAYASSIMASPQL